MYSNNTKTNIVERPEGKLQRNIKGTRNTERNTVREKEKQCTKKIYTNNKITFGCKMHFRKIFS